MSVIDFAILTTPIPAKHDSALFEGHVVLLDRSDEEHKLAGLHGGERVMRNSIKFNPRYPWKIPQEKTSHLFRFLFLSRKPRVAARGFSFVEKLFVSELIPTEFLLLLLKRRKCR
jgi:hypothetical protein